MSYVEDDDVGLERHRVLEGKANNDVVVAKNLKKVWLVYFEDLVKLFAIKFRSDEIQLTWLIN